MYWCRRKVTSPHFQVPSPMAVRKTGPSESGDRVRVPPLPPAPSTVTHTPSPEIDSDDESKVSKSIEVFSIIICVVFI